MRCILIASNWGWRNTCFSLNAASFFRFFSDPGKNCTLSYSKGEVGQPDMGFLGPHIIFTENNEPPKNMCRMGDHGKIWDIRGETAERRLLEGAYVSFFTSTERHKSIFRILSRLGLARFLFCRFVFWLRRQQVLTSVFLK